MNSLKLYIATLICRMLPETRCFKLKRILFKWCGVDVGDNTRIASSVTILGTGKLRVGSNTWIGHNSTIICSHDICIGNNVDIAPCVYIGDGSHYIDKEGVRIAGQGVCGSISIGDGCWICVNSTILPFTKIGEKSIIAAGSTVKGNIPSNEVWGGSLAKKIKSI